ncbi:MULTISPECIES: alkyl sulfatase C-terminal domain-containing protein [Cupriavidus]|nr:MULTISPECIES: alkyl sulfatase C-terminal domain-containing protein [Cupriavidus]MDF3887323.1 alkyl sulfatase C-terminal domain-containing protein [Cupriavidus basilensis]
MASGDLVLSGRRDALEQLLAMLDTYPSWFKVVTPNPDPS